MTLTGRPAPGYRFAGWTGSLGGRDNPAKLIMDAPKSVGAEFEQVLSIEPLALTLPAEGRQGAIQVSASAGGWKVIPIGARAWLKAATSEKSVEVDVTPNPTCYPRTALLKIASDQPNVAPVLASVCEEGQALPKPAAPTAKGLAVYRGEPGETGTLRWWSGNGSDPQYGLLEARDDGGLTVGCYRGTALGCLTTDGEAPLSIPDGHDYHIYANWDIPSNPEAIGDPDSGMPVSAYLYVGIDSGGVDCTKLRFGVEWKDMGKGKEWVARAQRDSDPLSAVEANNGKVPSHIKLHIWKDSQGDTVLKPGAAAVRAQFSLDDGPWQDFAFTDKRTPNFYPIEGMGHDAGADLVTFKARGLGSDHLREIRVEGLDVPGVNGPAQ